MHDKSEFRAEIKATFSVTDKILIGICWLFVIIMTACAVEINIVSGLVLYIGIGCLPYIILKAMHNYLASNTYLTLSRTIVNGTIKRMFSAQNVSLPLDRISGIGITENISYGGKIVTFSTSSGIIRFPWVQNAEEFVAKANAYINEYKSKAQEENKSLIAAVASNLNTPAPAPAAPQSAASKIKELKDLLDSGLISNEEFEQKRKELLNNM